MATSNKVFLRQVTFDVCLPFYCNTVVNNNDGNKSSDVTDNEFCFKSSFVKLHNFEFSLEVHPTGYGNDNSGYISVFLVNTQSPPVPKDLNDYRVSYSISILSIDKDNERLPKKGYTTHGFRSQNSWGYRRFLSNDVLHTRKFIHEDSLLKFRVTVRIEVDDYDFDRYIISSKDNDDDYCIVNSSALINHLPMNSSNGVGLG